MTTMFCPSKTHEIKHVEIASVFSRIGVKKYIEARSTSTMCIKTILTFRPSKLR